MTSTDTQGISACDQAFEEKYKISSRDPSNEGDLAIWRDAWAAKGADALAAIKAARVEPAQSVPIEEYRQLLARCIELGEKIAFRKGVILDANEAQYLAARLRRLFAHFGLSLPEGRHDDARLIGIAGAAIGMLLTRWECGDPQPAAWVNGEDLHGKANATIACGAERREVKGDSYDTPLYLAAPTAIKAARVQALEEAAKLVQDYDTYGDPTQGWQDIFAERIRLLGEDAGKP